MTALDIDFDDENATPPQPPAAAPEPKRKHLPQPIILPASRMLPHSPEAEEHLLSCILIEGSTTLEDCLELKLPPQAFHSAANALVYRHLVSIFEKQKVIDIAILAEELKRSGALETVGGYAYLTKITSAAPTTAQAPYFLSKVSELYQRRELIKISTSAVEKAYANDGETSALIESTASSIESIASSASALGLLEGRAYDPNNQAVKPTPVFTAKNTTICTPGNLTTFYAQAKVGKTATLGAMLAATMLPVGDITDCLGFEGPNPNGYAVIHIDTEQSRFDYETMIRNACKRGKESVPPPWLMTYHLTGLGAAECRSVIKTLLRLGVRRFKKIHSVFIDGIGDLVVNPNDPEECFPLIVQLHGLAIEYNCPIINVLHMNAGSDNEKGRGHLGSQLERKSESNIMLEKNSSEVTTYWATKQRGKTITKREGPTFKWSDEHNMHMSCEREDSDRPAQDLSKYDLKKMLPLLPKRTERFMSVSAIHKAVSSEFGISCTDLRDLLKQEKDSGLLESQTTSGMGTVYRSAL